jgi:hypothetical protein
MIRRLMLAGYLAARDGSPAAANPYLPGSVGDLAWSFGWNIGDLPCVPRMLCAVALGLL